MSYKDEITKRIKAMEDAIYCVDFRDARDHLTGCISKLEGNLTDQVIILNSIFNADEFKDLCEILNIKFNNLGGWLHTELIAAHEAAYKRRILN